jgi:Fe-S cluster biosynthesis and repair protein YggX
MAASSLRTSSEPADSPGWTVAELIRAATAAPAVLDGKQAAVDTVDNTWAETLDLVERATQTVLVNEKRLVEVEADNRALETRLSEEIRSLNARMEATKALVHRAEAALDAAEERARQAEERAAAAEGWLARIREQVLVLRRT